MCYFDCFVAEWGTHAHKGIMHFYLGLPKIFKAIESCDVIMNFSFPLTQRLKNSSDITKENEIDFDSKEFFYLLRVGYKKAQISPLRVCVTVLMHSG